MNSNKSWLIHRGGSGLQTWLSQTLAHAGNELVLVFILFPPCCCHLSGKSRNSRKMNLPALPSATCPRLQGKGRESPAVPMTHSGGSEVALVNGKF